ncbi:MAG: helix-turn-helix transcriptional regulator [Clostridia bacterium]|nr:helix-turn-helix transcriptional regulator [Clostridia bacterium]
MDILSNLSIRLTELMQEAELNNAALADKIETEQSVISKFKRAERMPSCTTLVKLADFFQCSTDYLLGLSDNLNFATYRECPPFNEQLNFLLKYFNKTKYRLEKDTKLTEETVNRWQKGIYEPTVESLVRLAKYFNCSVDFVLGREK